MDSILPALNAFRHDGECLACHRAKGFASLVTGHPPAQSAISLGMLGVGKTWAITGDVTVPPGSPSQCFSNFADILSRLSSICFLLLYGN